MDSHERNLFDNSVSSDSESNDNSEKPGKHEIFKDELAHYLHCVPLWSAMDTVARGGRAVALALGLVTVPVEDQPIGFAPSYADIPHRALARLGLEWPSLATAAQIATAVGTYHFCRHNWLSKLLLLKQEGDHDAILRLIIEAGMSTHKRVLGLCKGIVKEQWQHAPYHFCGPNWSSAQAAITTSSATSALPLGLRLSEMIDAHQRAQKEENQKTDGYDGIRKLWAASPLQNDEDFPDGEEDAFGHGFGTSDVAISADLVDPVNGAALSRRGIGARCRKPGKSKRKMTDLPVIASPPTDFSVSTFPTLDGHQCHPSSHCAS